MATGTTTASTVEEYQAVLRCYQEAETTVRNTLKLIRDVAANLSGNRFTSFIGYRFGIHQLDPNTWYDVMADVSLNNWPDREQISDRIHAWNSALTDLQEAWERLPKENRIGFSEPPKKLDPKLP